MNTHANQRGFTLIELLVVIAIISILAGLIAVGLPYALERAKIAKTKSVFRSVDTAMGAYLSEYGTYPAAYGYRYRNKAYDPNFDPPEDEYPQVLAPWTQFVGLTSEPGINDPFSRSYDTNRDNVLQYFEFLPIVSLARTAPTTIYPGPGGPFAGDMASQVNDQLAAEARPVIYIPVNLDDMRKIEHYAYQQGPSINSVDRMFMRWTAAEIAGGHQGLATLNPDPADDPHIPSKYDAYVLISVGPFEDTCGLLYTPNPLETYNDWYSAGLKTYFMATRDVNDNGAFDMDYEARRGVDGGTSAFENTGYGGAGQLVLTPDGRPVPGPMIHRSN